MILSPFLMNKRNIFRGTISLEQSAFFKMQNTNVFVLIKYKLRCINDLVHEINKLNVRIELVNPKPFMLIKADDSEIYRRFTMYVK